MPPVNLKQSTYELLAYAADREHQPMARLATRAIEAMFGHGTPDACPPTPSTPSACVHGLAGHDLPACPSATWEPSVVECRRCGVARSLDP